MSVGIATLSFVALVGIYFVPLWITEQTIQTPEDYMRLAERFATRGQLLGNPTKAQALYRKAAEGGSIEAQARLGEALYFGHYGTINRDEGIYWLKSAAAHEHLKAQYLVESLEKK